jgi:hypothetical protein
VRTLLLAAGLALAVPGCVFAAGNKATARDVEKPTGDPRQPESVFSSVEFDAAGLSSLLYEAPADRAFVVKDLRIDVPCDVVGEVAGAVLLLVPSAFLETDGSSSRWTSRSEAGVKLPAGARLRLQRTAGSTASEVRALVAGELVRL